MGLSRFGGLEEILMVRGVRFRNFGFRVRGRGVHLNSFTFMRIRVTNRSRVYDSLGTHCYSRFSALGCGDRAARGGILAVRRRGSSVTIGAIFGNCSSSATVDYCARIRGVSSGPVILRRISSLCLSLYVPHGHVGSSCLCPFVRNRRNRYRPEQVSLFRTKVYSVTLHYGRHISRTGMND